MREFFQVWATDSAGNDLEIPRRCATKKDVLDYFSLRCPRMDLRKLRHFVELARAAPNGPGVDVTHWEAGQSGCAARMLFSARLRYVREIPDISRES